VVRPVRDCDHINVTIALLVHIVSMTFTNRSTKKQQHGLTGSYGPVTAGLSKHVALVAITLYSICKIEPLEIFCMVYYGEDEVIN
jgi:hypothetical protein